MIFVPDPLLFLAYCAACVGIGLVPGPNVALIVANSLAHGARYGLASVAGAALGSVPLLALAALGTTALAHAAVEVFEILRWAGVGVMVYLAYTVWTAPPVQTEAQAQPRPLWEIFMHGAVVAVTNPKCLVLFLVLPPQFVSPTAATVPQVFTLLVTVWAIFSVMEGAWALLAARARPWLANPGVARWRGRILGGLFGVGALGLALTHRG
jgi:homoserine/homoserine lactone efflux protein